MEQNEMKTVDIKGKLYVEVNQRILYFRANYPNGRIVTDLISVDNGVAIIKAHIYIDDVLVATGHAYEKEGSTFINKTSYIENCETSAVGRALGIFGIGIDTSIASSEEVQNAIAQQEALKNAKKNLPDKCKLECGGDEALAREGIKRTLEQLGYEKWQDLDLSRTSETVFLKVFNTKVNEIEAEKQ